MNNGFVTIRAPINRRIDIQLFHGENTDCTVLKGTWSFLSSTQAISRIFTQNGTYFCPLSLRREVKDFWSRNWQWIYMSSILNVYSPNDGNRRLGFFKLLKKLNHGCDCDLTRTFFCSARNASRASDFWFVVRNGSNDISDHMKRQIMLENEMPYPDTALQFIPDNLAKSGSRTSSSQKLRPFLQPRIIAISPWNLYSVKWQNLGQMGTSFTALGMIEKLTFMVSVSLWHSLRQSRVFQGVG
jgi:hypothetical protein